MWRNALLLAIVSISKAPIFLVEAFSGEACGSLTEAATEMCPPGFDVTLDSRWRSDPDAPKGEVEWSKTTRAFVKNELDKGTTVAHLTLPKVFVYPFPPEFRDMRAFLEREYVPLALARNPKKDPLLSAWNTQNLSYFRIASGIWREGLTEQKFEADGSWNPSLDIIGKWEGFRLGLNKSECQLLYHQGNIRDLEAACGTGGFEQHALGFLLHHGLTSGTYPNLVKDPAEADLFFIPDHIDPTNIPKNLGIDIEDWCSAVGPAWLRHIESFASSSRDEEHGAPVSYAARLDFGDHFYVFGRALHHSDNILELKHIASVLESKDADVMHTANDCGYRRRGYRQAHRLVLESQSAYDRGCGRTHPVPYQSLFPWRPGADWGAAWSAHREARHFAASGYFRDDEKDKSGARSLFRAQCDAWPDCHMLETEDQRIHFVQVYRNSLFTLQPGGHSAARRGIVDSLMTGAIPVLFKDAPENPGRFSVKDQRDLWPWHWPWQSAASIILNLTELEHMNEELQKVDRPQRTLMTRLIAQRAANLAWPANYASNQTPKHARTPNALELAMHHLFHAAKAAATEDFQITCDAVKEYVSKVAKAHEWLGTSKTHAPPSER